MRVHLAADVLGGKSDTYFVSNDSGGGYGSSNAVNLCLATDGFKSQPCNLLI